LTHRALTVPRYQILRVLNRLFLYSCSKPEHPPVGDHSCTTGIRTRNLCYDSWNLCHLGYFYPRTTPVMIKLDHNWSCLWVLIAQVTKAPTIRSSLSRTCLLSKRIDYRVISGHRNWQIKTAVWNLDGFLLFRSHLPRILVSFA